METLHTTERRLTNPSERNIPPEGHDLKYGSLENGGRVCLFERIDVINSLSYERTFIEQILIKIRDNTGIGINASLSAEKACVFRLVCAGQARPDPWLQNSISLVNTSQISFCTEGDRPGGGLKDEPLHLPIDERSRAASCVSVSRVMTYLTSDSIAVLPTIAENASLPPPRKNTLRSASFPRLRSWPIHAVR